jgi:uncharacterized protein
MYLPVREGKHGKIQNCKSKIANPKMRSAQFWKEKLQLSSHVEGGAFSEVYRSGLALPKEVLTSEHHGSRNAMTSIYFLLEYGEFSAFHRIASDELWHHYDGDTLCIYEILTDGTLKKYRLGTDNNALPFAVIEAGSWFASGVEIEGGYTLCGCTVAPGFDFADFELADKSTLSSEFPLHTTIIAQLAR